MKKVFRQDYKGEFVYTSVSYTKGNVWQEREWVPNTITNLDHSGYACVIGNGPSRLKIDVNLITTHRGGLLGQKKMESYGCNALYRTNNPDVLVVTSREIADEIAATDYPQNNIVLARNEHIKKHPGLFHLIPYNNYTDAGSTALRMACFDGHQQVYMLGFDGQLTPHQNDNVYAGTNGYQGPHTSVTDDYWIDATLEVMNTYTNVQFIRVMSHDAFPLPEKWKYATNLRTISFNQFVHEVDLGC